jgi:hypothetical protein
MEERFFIGMCGAGAVLAPRAGAQKIFSTQALPNVPFVQQLCTFFFEDITRGVRAPPE